MIFNRYFENKFPNVWVRCNIQYTLIGLLIGVFVNVVFRVIGNYSMPWQDVLMTFIVSIIITLSITNISILSDEIIRKRFKSPFSNTIIYYLLVFAGVLVGTELSIVCITLLYDVPFSDVDQGRNLSRNLTIGLLVGTVIYIYKLQSDNYELQMREKELEVTKLRELKTNADLQTLQARINPHFLYNALNSITSLIHEAPDKAEDMTIKLSQLFRYSINTQDANWSTVQDELQMVNIYIDIERVRFGNRIAFSASADESVFNQVLPRFIMQPLVENALKHGLKNTNVDGVLSVFVKDGGEDIIIEIHDNGESFPSDMLAGYGVQSIHDKINLLYVNKGSMNFVNSPRKMAVVRLPKKSAEA